MSHLVFLIASPAAMYIGMMSRPAWLRVPLVVLGVVGMFVEVINMFEFLMHFIV